VIGASSSVGREVGLAASRAGARVAFAARRRDLLDSAAAEAGRGALAVACDVCAPDDCARAVGDTVSAFGGIDALVYATGMSPLVMLEQASTQAWRRVLDVNVIGASQITAAVLPQLRKSEGRAVYVSSYAVRQSLPGLAPPQPGRTRPCQFVEPNRLHGSWSGTLAATSSRDWGGRRSPAMRWVSRNLFPATMMSLRARRAILSVIAVRGYVDDIAIMSRARDAKAEGVP
jgi:NAD(P)-dependent dehydrogenase (short-subunit alcohol dehydrogenase family)